MLHIVTTWDKAGNAAQWHHKDQKHEEQDNDAHPACSTQRPADMRGYVLMAVGAGCRLRGEAEVTMHWSILHDDQNRLGRRLIDRLVGGLVDGLVLRRRLVLR